jgi:hypothetical protein
VKVGVEVVDILNQFVNSFHFSILVVNDELNDCCAVGSGEREVATASAVYSLTITVPVPDKESDVEINGCDYAMTIT